MKPFDHDLTKHHSKLSKNHSFAAVTVSFHKCIQFSRKPTQTPSVLVGFPVTPF